MPVSQNHTAFIPIGGVGEFGANAAIVQTPATTILIDFGLMFPPDSRQPGVDYYVIDPDRLLKLFPNISAIFLTHGHEDHIGGLPHLLPVLNVPVYAVPYTARLVKFKMQYGDCIPNLIEVSLDDPVKCGDIEVSFIGVTHSIQHACALAIRTPGGTIVHSGDFKVDPLPGDDHPFRSDRFEAWGDRGVDLLVMDSTNASRNGFCPSDQMLVPHWEAIVSEAKGRVFFTTFSSHIPRIKKLLKIARRQKRVVACLGRSLQRHLALAQDTGYLGAEPDVLVSSEEAMGMPHEKVIFAMTGSQGEPRSATSRILNGNFKGLTFQSADTVIFASRAIPGNERQMALLTSDMERLGVNVVTPRDRSVHTSGHAYREELAYLLALIRPRTVVPIHGEFHHLLRHFEWLKAILGPGQDLSLIEDGEQLLLTPEGVVLEGRKKLDLLPIDGNQERPLSRHVLRDRKNMMYSGLMLISWQDSNHGNPPEIEVKTLGMVLASEEAVCARVAQALGALDCERNPTGEIWAKVLRREARAVLKPIFKGRPVVKCIVNGRIY